MHQSGITVSESLKREFTRLDADPNTLYAKIVIENDDFSLAAEGNQAGSEEANFAACQALLQEKEPAFVLKRAAGSPKWLVIFFVPEKSPVRMKMIYASSTGALKSGLGGAKFMEDFPISIPSECTLAEYEQFTNGTTAEHVMSYEERQTNETRYESAHALSDSKVSAIVGIPIKIADDAIEALKGIKSGTNKTVVLVLDPKTEVLGCEPPSDAEIAGFQFPEKEPRYFVHNFKHTRDGEEKNKIVFVYYCPGRAVPKLKMFYSTCKANIIKLFANLEITDFQNYECNEAAECTEELLLEEIYPKAAVDKSFKKPAARGRGKARIAKFKA